MRAGSWWCPIIGQRAVGQVCPCRYGQATDWRRCYAVATIEECDGQRAQLHVRDHPVTSAVLDGEAVAGDGSEGIRAVFEARRRPGSPMAFAAFDLLRGGRPRASWASPGRPGGAARGSARAPAPGVCLVPVTDDAPALWDTWTGLGGEGIVLRHLERSGSLLQRLTGQRVLEIAKNLLFPILASKLCR